MRNLLVLSLLLPLGCGGSAQDVPAIRNVLLLCIDTLRPDHLGAYGYDRPTSPAIDAIARTGIVCEQAIAQAPWTTPSIASLLTSLYPSAMGLGPFADPGRVDANVITLAETLRAAGVRTHAVTEKGGTNREFGFDQGFETYDHDGGWVEQGFTRAQEWIAGLGRDERFFLFLHTYAVHSYSPPARFRARFVPAEPTTLPTEGLARHLQSRLDGETLTPADWRHVRGLYDASIAHVDAMVGRLVGALRAAGRLDETLLIITSDHGEEFGEHGATGHGYTLFDENLRVPLILRHPALAPGRIPAQVRLLDVAPTVAQLLEVPVPRSWQGESLVPFWHGRAGDRLAFAECAQVPLKAMRTPRFKYVAAFGLRPHRLYDLAADPGETRDLAEEPASAERLAAVRTAMAGWLRANQQRVDAIGSGARPALGREVAAELEALGYVGASSPASRRGLDAWLRLMEERVAPVAGEADAPGG